MRIFNRIAIVRHGRSAEVHSYSFADEGDSFEGEIKIRLITQSGTMDIDAEDLAVLIRAIELFKHAENS